MKRIFYLMLMLVMAVACSQTEDEAGIRNKIKENRQLINELNNENAMLENKLASFSDSAGSSYSIPVEVKELSFEKFNHYFDVSGTVEAVREAFISPELSGQIKEIYVKEGDQVKKGQLLARLNTDITETGINEVKVALNHATTVYEKQKRLWDKGIGSEMQYLDAKNGMEALENKLATLEVQRAMAVIKSPVNGVVDEIFSKTGELAMPGIQLMQVINLDELYINIDVSESYLSMIHPGALVDVSFPVYPDLDMQVPVYRTGNYINPKNRTFKVQLNLSNKNDMLKPNILAIIRFNDYSSAQALVVPSKIIKQDITGSYIYKLNGEGNTLSAKKVYIETGKSYQGYTMVKEGLAPGDRVVTKGYTQVSDGAKVALNNI